MDMHLLIFRMERKVKVWQGKYETYTIKFSPFFPPDELLGENQGKIKGIFTKLSQLQFEQSCCPRSGITALRCSCIGSGIEIWRSASVVGPGMGDPCSRSPLVVEAHIKGNFGPVDLTGYCFGEKLDGWMDGQNICSFEFL